MNKSKELKNVTKIVKEILEKNPETRSSDDLLYYRVCEKINGIFVTLPFWKVLVNRNKYNLPSYETVGRVRRKLQRAFPELRACEDVENQRTLNEDVFRDYAKAVKV